MMEAYLSLNDVAFFYMCSQIRYKLILTFYDEVFTLSTIGFNIKIFYILLITCIIAVFKDLNRRAIILTIQH